jgi:TPR repeat protein
MGFKISSRRFLLSIGFAVAFSGASVTALAAGEAEVALAQEAVADFRYGTALVHFRAAAEQGNRFAQRTAGLMLLKSEALYRGEIKSDHAEAMKWLKAAADNGCEASKFVLKKSAGSGHVVS